MNIVGTELLENWMKQVEQQAKSGKVGLAISKTKQMERRIKLY
jgi:hypothetical protein